MKMIQAWRLAVSHRRSILLYVFAFLNLTLYGLTYNVTVPTGTKACYFAGEITGWSQQAMSKTDETHYTITYDNATATQQYKYCSGPGWAYVEDTPNGANRTYSANDVVSSWALIFDPETVAQDVTYNVTVPVGTYSCYFAGAATNWSHQQMNRVDNTHYTITIKTTTPNAYKYCSGPDWIYEELDAADNAIPNRNYSTADVVVKWKAVYNPTPTGLTYNVTVPSGTKACYLAGDMNSWTFQSMNKTDETHYSLFVTGAIATQAYKYSCGPDWSFEELNSDNTAVNNRNYTSSDVVSKWAAVWNPDGDVSLLSNSLVLSSGKVDRYSFNTTTIGVRTVDVWLPDGYTPDKKYTVLYMHDGQMLFDATSTWNGQEWRVDETINSLLQNYKIKDVIVVGVWNSSNRYAEYYPEKTLDYLPEAIKSQKNIDLGNNPKSDEYLSFLVGTLKPFIDKTYSVYTDRLNTVVAGSSMGGLISWYALCEYPDVFGAAICMSTHWVNNSLDDPSIPDSFRKYMLAHLPPSVDHVLYFDHGTEGLDANYAQHQELVDTIVKYKGYISANCKSLVFNGDDHNETCWANRLSTPLSFVLSADTNYQLQLNTEVLNNKGFVSGETVTISWISSLVKNVRIEYSTDNGTSWNVIATSVQASQNNYDWTIPAVNSTLCKLRILDADMPSNVSCSGLFTIAQAIVNIKFSVDMSLLISQNKFSATEDKVYVRGSFNNYGLTHQLISEQNGIYSITVSLPASSYVDYKYFISTSGADNSGWENNFPATYNGNRVISYSNNNLQLATVYYNDADMNLVKISEHFKVIYTNKDVNDIDRFINRLEKFYKTVTSALEVIPIDKTEIYLYKDLEHLHLAQGYPENSAFSTGSAYGKSLLIMLSPATMGMDEALGLVAHEYTHCINAWKTKVILPAWLNEGVACYFGRNFSTKDWIKSVMDVKGKPDVDKVFDTDMGYAYSSILAYYLIKTKGMHAVAKFVENMNYADIGYANLAELQIDWHKFLDTYLDYLVTVNVTFTVDMTDMVAAGYFKPDIDNVYVKGDWNFRNAQLLSRKSGNLYTVTVPVNRYWLYEYKFWTNSSLAPNNGLELDADETISGYRLLDAENADITISPVKFSSIAPEAITGVNMERIINKVEVLSHQGRIWGSSAFSTFKYPFKILTPFEYQSQKATDSFAFEAGFVGSNDTIYISQPTTNDQLAVFSNTTDVALYYLCQSYMYHFYQTKNLPLLFKTGFPLFEAGLLPNDTIIKKAVNDYGCTFSSFDVLNNPTTFIQNNGLAVAGAFGEFMNVFKNWGYPMVSNITSGSFDVVSYWFNVDNLSGLLGDFNRYITNRFLQSDNNLRIRLYQETEHFKFYTRPVDAMINFPLFPTVCETAYNEYATNYKSIHKEKVSFFTLPECVDADLEGATCGNRVTGGTAWSSGVHSTCAANTDQLLYFEGMCRHELAHSFQGIFPQGTVTAWLNEGFPSFCSDGIITDTKLGQMRQTGIDCMEAANRYFGHRPTYEDTRVYPTPDYGYYTLGYFFIDYQYRRGGYPLIKAIQMNDVTACQSIGYNSPQELLDDFYYDFDVRVAQKSIVNLNTPVANATETGSTVSVNWVPLRNNVALNVYVSTDEAKSWTAIASNITSTSCIWNANNYRGRFYLKFSAPDKLNVFTTFGPFVKGDLNALDLIQPISSNYLIAGDTINIKWSPTNIPSIKLEYAQNESTQWILVESTYAATEDVYKWIIPSTLNGVYKIRISDASNPSVYSIVNQLNILTSNETCGPYLNDKNTVLLLHFDNGLENRCHVVADAVSDVDVIAIDQAVSSQMGQCVKTGSLLKVPQHTLLNLNGDWTIEAWVKFNSFTANNNMYLFWKPGDTDTYQSNYSLELNPWWGNTFYAYCFSELNSRIGVGSNTSPSLNEWYHVAFVRDTHAKQLNLYVRDKYRTLIESRTLSYSPEEILLNSNDLRIGVNMDGYLDEIRISNTVRKFTNTGSENPNYKNSFTVVPNPATERVVLNGLEDNSQVELLDVNGKLVLRGTYKDNDVIDLSFLSKGLYFVRVTDANSVSVQKIIKN